jgi:hypothetical protein
VAGQEISFNSWKLESALPQSQEHAKALLAFFTILILMVKGCHTLHNPLKV